MKHLSNAMTNLRAAQPQDAMGTSFATSKTTTTVQRGGSMKQDRGRQGLCHPRRSGGVNQPLSSLSLSLPRLPTSRTDPVPSPPPPPLGDICPTYPSNDDDVSTLTLPSMEVGVGVVSTATMAVVGGGGSLTATTASNSEESHRKRKTFIGCHVRKYFPGYGFFKGQAVAYDEPYYQVKYEDGDEEEYTEAQLLEIIDRQDLQNHSYGTRNKRVCQGIESRQEQERLTAKVPTVCIPADIYTVSYDLWQTHLLCPGKALEKLAASPKLQWIPTDSRERVALLFLFMSERQRMWVRRNRNETQPWTANGILSANQFCNVYRELDRGTGWFRSYVLDLCAQQDQRCWTRCDWTTEVLWASYAYRQVNSIETFRNIGFPEREKQSIEAFKAKAREYARKNKTFFTSVHKTANVTRYLENLSQVCKDDAERLEEVSESIYAAQSLSACMTAIKRLPGLTPFMAWQILCDLRESRCLLFDDEAFCAFGPGATAGIKDLFPKSQSTESIAHLGKLLVGHQKEIFDVLDIEFPYWRGRTLTLKELERGLCEFNKFLRIEAKISPEILFDSREELDVETPCQICSYAKDLDGVICETCLGAYCQKCMKQDDAEAISFICPRCIGFENFCCNH